MLVCANFTGKHSEACPLSDEWKDAKTLIHNYAGEIGEELRPYEAVILLKE